jgi:hypothetical protein
VLDGQAGPRCCQAMLLQALISAGCSAASASTAGPRANLSIAWDSPTIEPGVAHRNTNGPVIGGGMPLGNGEVAVLAFPLVPVVGSNFSLPAAGDFVLQSSISFFVSMTTAMASDTSPFKLGMVSLVTDPPLFEPSLQAFEQRLDMDRAFFTVRATSKGGRSVVAQLFVDANSNTISVSLNSSEPLRLFVRVQSVHPPTRFAYGGGFLDWMGHSMPEVSGPDIFEAAPMSAPTAGTVVISHRNEDNDFPAAFNYTLRQQGLGALTAELQSSDRWRHRQFGMIVSGTSGSKVRSASTGQPRSTANDPLVQLNSSTLCSSAPSTQFDLTISMHANQTVNHDEWLAQLTGLHRVTTSEGTAAKREEAHVSWWDRFWRRSHVWVSESESGGDSSTTSRKAAASSSEAVQRLTQTYAATRYVQAIQSRTWVPIKFNGELFTATLPPETKNSGPSYRQWGANSWWQNTRLAYWNMAASADFENLASIFEFYHQTLDFAARRTIEYFNHTGIFYTETKTLFGSYSVAGYGDAAKRPLNLPVARELCSAMNFDFGGDAGGPEVSMMILDHYDYTGNHTALVRFFPIVSLTLDFFRQHYTKRDGNGRMVIWPTQALEKYKCANMPQQAGAAWQPPNATNCIENDTPTVVALHVLLERVLRLPVDAVPAGTITEVMRKQWRQLQAILPPVPMQAGSVESVLPYGSYPVNYNETVNRNGYETPEMFPVHPYRFFSVGREKLGVKRPRTPAVNCLLHAAGTPEVCKNAQANMGWTQLPMTSALLGQADLAQRAVLERAMAGSAVGYRFIGFAPHEQDYEPAEDQYANMNSGLQWMLVQPADDGNSSSIVFGAWPCEWDVSFKLAAPGPATIEGELKGGKVVKMVIDPPSHAQFVHVMPCQTHTAGGDKATNKQR